MLPCQPESQESGLTSRSTGLPSAVFFKPILPAKLLSVVAYCAGPVAGELGRWAASAWQLSWVVVVLLVLAAW